MKKILITGETSYIGTSLIKWLQKDDIDYEIKSITVRDDNWKLLKFSKYDTIVHIAGIAHIKENSKNRGLYDKINNKLTQQLAKKAKEENVRHFIFISSMSVYGDIKGGINEYTVEKPNTAYGISKLNAEKYLLKISNDNFKVCIIRPPMVYGKGSKGNYKKLSALSKKMIIFPKVINKRSMIFIDNLSIYLLNIIKEGTTGIVLPSDREIVSTWELVRTISSVNNNKMYFTSIFNGSILVLIPRIKILRKIFGSLYYEIEGLHLKNYSGEQIKNELISFEQSIRLTEGKE